MVVGFNQAVKVAAELTSDRAIVAKGIQRLQMDDGTSLYNAVSELFENRLSSITGPTAVIIMTDGVDTTSRKASYESSLVSAENRTATVFPVYFNTYESSQTNAAALTAIFPMMIPRRTVEMDKAEYELGRFYLSDLLRLSGGHAVVVKDGDKGKIDGLDAIPAELRARYYIRLRLPDGGKTGERHRVMIGVNQPDLIVRAKGSYIGK